MKKIYLIAAMVCAGAFSAGAQIISTVAGNATATLPGDGGPATAALIQGPYGVTLDHSGNMYIADQYANRVRKVTAAGTISTIAGTGVAGYSGDGLAATAAKLNSPAGVAVDAAGNVYISDMLNNVIRKVNTSGIISTYAGNLSMGNYGGDGGPATASTVYLHTPIGMTVDASGNLYIAEVDNDIIRVVSSAGVINTFAGIPAFGGYSGDSAAATDARLNQPIDVKLDAAGNVYIADNSNDVIRKVDLTGTITTIAGTGTPGFSGEGGQAALATLYGPTGLAISSNGQIFISDAQNQRVRVIYPSGVIYTLGGHGATGYTGDGGLAHYATMHYPYSGVLDTSRNFYFADFDNNAIRRITPFHNHVPVFAAGTSTSATVCANSTNDTLDTHLAVSDLDTNQTVNWFVATAPAHGTVVCTSTALTTGATLAASGILYTPTAGYSGTDLIRFIATDGIDSSIITLNISVVNALSAPGITGADSVCQYDTVLLTPSVSGGTWSVSNTTLATALTSGKIVGDLPGMDTAIYTISNVCGSVFAIKQIFVKSHDTCLLRSGMIVAQQPSFTIYPNPSAGVFYCMVTGSGKEQVSMCVTDLLGNKVRTVSLPQNRENEIRLDVPAGIYFYEVRTSTGLYTGKLEVRP